MNQIEHLGRLFDHFVANLLATQDGELLTAERS